MSNRIKVVYYCPSESLYGDNIALLNIIPFLQTIGVEPFFVVAENGPFVERLIDNGYNYYVCDYRAWNMYELKGAFKNWIFFGLRLIKNRWRLAKHLQRALDVIDNFQPTLVHSNSSNSSFGFLLAKKLNIPHVWHLREFGRYDSKIEFFPSKDEFVNKLDVDFNHCISITPQIFDYFGSRGNNRIIYDGVIKNYINKPELKERTKKQFLFVGRLVESKGIFEVLKAFEEVCRLDKVVNLCIAGTGTESYVKELKSFITQLELDDRVSFLGYRSDIFELMSESVAIVVASEFEAFGFITVEAMFNGCIVIGNNTGGTKVQFDNGIQNTGHEIGLRYTNRQELVANILEISEKNWGAYVPMLTRAQDTVVKLYLASSSAEEVFDYYKEILKLKA